METFVVRVWIPAVVAGEPTGVAAGVLKGIVEHIGSGRAAPFKGADQLLGLLLAGIEASERVRDRQRESR